MGNNRPARSSPNLAIKSMTDGALFSQIYLFLSGSDFHSAFLQIAAETDIVTPKVVASLKAMSSKLRNLLIKIRKEERKKSLSRIHISFKRHCIKQDLASGTHPVCVCWGHERKA
ncbi:hypothetical protein T265_12332 [Opisthorchis viverrini]|uniref:Uncharacterized protein n=1 Tax=Opisthorchis viverrini TaxID=6198 RepID=A0A074YU37_OPIVI|nr:hypothetical protein T265_12332 [Opisthorchis viverrini]KER18228.1 hypothetical protein T265_12332 [Opisthorchis viverrini]